MSAPVHHETMQQIADRVGVSRRSLFYAQAVHRYGCPELLKAAESERLALKHCATLAKALPHDEQREFLAELPNMTPRQRHDLLALLKGDILHRQRQDKPAKDSHG